MSDQGPRGGQRPGATRGPSSRPPSKRPAPAPKRGGNGGILEGITGGDQQTTIGLALIAFAIVLGLIFLLKGFSDDDGLVAVDEPETSSTTVPEVDRDAPPVVDSTPDTTATLREPGEVAVLVANGSGVTGAASRTADELRADGYDVINTANALSQVTETEIHHAEGFEAEAQALAEALGIEDPVLEELVEPGPVEDAEGADLVVVLGPDLAAAASSGDSTATTSSDGSSSTTSSGTSSGGTSGGTSSGTGGTSGGTGATSGGASTGGGSSTGGSTSGASGASSGGGSTASGSTG